MFGKNKTLVRNVSTSDLEPVAPIVIIASINCSLVKSRNSSSSYNICSEEEMVYNIETIANKMTESMHFFNEHYNRIFVHLQIL